MSNKRYLLVGGAGYFGARLAEALVGEVVVTERTVAPERTAWARAKGIKLLHYDSNQVKLKVEGDFDALVQLATPGASEATRDPDGAMGRARRVTEDCLALTKSGRVGRMIYFSTLHVYGTWRPRFEESDQPAPINPYSRTHVACEELVLDVPSTLVLRPSNLVGAPAHAALGDQAKLMFLDLCRQAVSGAIRMQNDGLSFRDFLPFEDAIAAVRLLFELSMPAERIFNLARGSVQRLDEVARMILHEAGATTLQFGKGSDAFRKPFEVDVSRLYRLGWQPQANLQEETRRILNFFR